MSDSVETHGAASTGGNVAAVWSLVGVAGLFLSAVYRLGARGVATMSGGLTVLEWIALALLTLVFLYGEGRRGLERRWIPGLIERARRLRYRRSLGLWLFAPIHGLGLIGGTALERTRAWLGTTAIVAAVLLVRASPEPWRGIIDFAVATALAWGAWVIVRTGKGAFD